MSERRIGAAVIRTGLLWTQGHAICIRQTNTGRIENLCICPIKYHINVSEMEPSGYLCCDQSFRLLASNRGLQCQRL